MSPTAALIAVLGQNYPRGGKALRGAFTRFQPKAPKDKKVEFKTMEIRHCPGLFLAVKILDIDGITGGFNFLLEQLAG